MGFDISKDKTGIKIDRNKYAADVQIVDVNTERVKQMDDDQQAKEKSMLRHVAGKMARTRDKDRLTI